MNKYLKSTFVIVLLLFGCNFQNQQIRVNMEILNDAKKRMLRDSQDEQALNIILELLKDKNNINRANAAAILGELAAKIGGQIKEKAVPPLCEMLDKGDKFDKHAAAEALLAFGVNAEKCIPVLRKNLLPADTSTSYFCAKALGKIGESAYVAVPDLLKIINDQNGGRDSENLNRETYIQTLGQIGPKAIQSVPILEVILTNSNNDSLKIQTAISLIKIDKSNLKSLKELKMLLDNHDEEVRRKILENLTAVDANSISAIEIIKSAQNDNNANVNQAAMDLLNILGTDANAQNSR